MLHSICVQKWGIFNLSKIWVIYDTKCKILDSTDTSCKIGDAANIRRKQRRFITISAK